MANVFKGIKNLFNQKKTNQPVDPIFTPMYSSKYNGGILPDQFHYNLSRTIAWTEKIVDSIRDPSSINYSKVLRTINPLYEGRPFYNFDGEYICPLKNNFNYAPLLFYILSLRREKINSTKDINSLGKILRFQIEITTVDGAPVAGSEGFVDLYDIPPIDTWFYITKWYLYCWIP